MINITLTGVVKCIIMWNGMNSIFIVGIIGIIWASKNEWKFTEEIVIRITIIVIMPMFNSIFIEEINNDKNK